MSFLVVAGADAVPSVVPAAGMKDPAPDGFGLVDVSSESSSIGSASSAASASSDDDRGGSDGRDEAESKEIKHDGSSNSLGSFSSLQDSLPINKGLSNHFHGKSRSFSNLSDCANGSAGDLAKGENPFNKRRRIQIANKISYKRRASCSSLIMTVLPPLLSPEHALQEAEEENDNDRDEEDGNDDRRNGFSSLAPTPHGGNLYLHTKIDNATLKPPRSFSLFDLRHV